MEAADLGIRLCQSAARSVYSSYLSVAVPVFAHRVIINARTSMTQRSTETAERILQDILTLVDVPV